MIRWTILLLVVLMGSVAALPKPVTAQANSGASVRIHVTDAIDGRPLNDARVGFLDLGLFVLTNAEGTADLRDIPPGDHLFEVTRLGYGRASGQLHLAAGSIGEDRVALSVQPFEIEGITVDGKRRWSSTLDKAGFYQRSKTGFGQYLDHDALVHRPATYLDEAVKRMLPCIGHNAFDAQTHGSGSFGTFGYADGPITTQAMRIGGNSWISRATDTGPVVFLNGTPWIGTLRDFPVDYVEGVEIYRSMAGIPAQYAGWAPCGVVLVWTII